MHHLERISSLVVRLLWYVSLLMKKGRRMLIFTCNVKINPCRSWKYSSLNTSTIIQENALRNVKQTNKQKTVINDIPLVAFKVYQVFNFFDMLLTVRLVATMYIFKMMCYVLEHFDNKVSSFFILWKSNLSLLLNHLSSPTYKWNLPCFSDCPYY